MGQNSSAAWEPNLSRQPAGFLLSRRRPEICGLAEFKPQLLLSRPEFFSKPAWGSTRDDAVPSALWNGGPHCPFCPYFHKAEPRAFSVVGPCVGNGLPLAQRLLPRVLSDTFYASLKNCSELLICIYYISINLCSAEGGFGGPVCHRACFKKNSLLHIWPKNFSTTFLGFYPKMYNFIRRKLNSDDLFLV